MRPRLLFAGATFAALVALVAIVLVLSGGGEEEHAFTAAPARCVAGWNDDPAAVTLGQHQSTDHHYSQVQVLTLTADADPVPESDPGALCAVAFASSTLDAELAAATVIKLPAGWRPPGDAAGPDRLAELQAEAKESYNATLTPEGRIEPLT